MSPMHKWVSRTPKRFHKSSKGNTSARENANVTIRDQVLVFRWHDLISIAFTIAMLFVGWDLWDVNQLQ